jgi:sugar/nucleoside kinase (ribokinase family)
VLCTLGDLLEDVVVWLDGPPRRGTDQAARIFRSRGGSAANVAAFAALTGTPSRFVGRVGDDPLGRRLADELRADGVDVWVERSGRTGTVVVLVEPGGERTMLPDRGAATHLGPVHDAWLVGVSLLHLPAYSLTVEPLATSALEAAGRARRAGALVTVDASSTAVLEAFGTGRARALLSRLQPDVLLANADEAAALGLLDDALVGVAWTVVKDGPRPVRVHGPDGGSATVDVPPVAVVEDTTGAGDAFAAGLLGALVAGAAVPHAVPVGIALAARVIARPGANLLREDG